MSEIKKITISGFRGINFPPLELDFQKNGNIQSMMIYGKNGSGKSSIVDAWEWLYTNKIEHLAREGAGERAFPHKKAKNNQTWIEVEFVNDKIGKIRCQYNPEQITKPIIDGNLSAMKRYIQHPCHLRYRDITNFVYNTKAEKYEILSQQMGFGKAINIQNNLQAGDKILADKIEKLKIDLENSCKDYYEACKEKPQDISPFMELLNSILKKHGISIIKDITDTEQYIEKLRKRVEEDDITKELQILKDVQKIIKSFYPIENICEKLSKFQEDLIEFKQDEEEISKLILIDLYEKGIEAIEYLKQYDNVCPLCDQYYEGNLLAHIKGKRSHLDKLSSKREELESKRKELLSLFDGIIYKFNYTLLNFEDKEIEPTLMQFRDCLKKLLSPVENCKNKLEQKIENIDKSINFMTKEDIKKFNFLIDSEEQIKKVILERIKKIEQDESRKILVEDFQKASKLWENFFKWNKLNKKIAKFEEIKNDYEQIKEDYIKDAKKGVQESFDIICSDVADYFNILEKESDILSEPKIKLYSERDKAVELEVIFGAEPISPAYKYLSESQLNSFGLSIFLASVKHFNPDFKFIILDDVINSFDIYKRPLVIDVLAKNFQDYQILLLTHDSIWLDQLQKCFPKWIKKQFSGWDYLIGPRVYPGKNCFEQTNELLLQDKPIEAGWLFGRYLEYILQELCENLETQVKYNKKNEYCLTYLFQSFRIRMQKKLEKQNSGHLIVKEIINFENNIGFRNFCDHWKESGTEYSSQEIRYIVQHWREIESKIVCDKCHKFIKYEKVNGYEHISCPCRKLNLKESKWYQ